MKKLIMKVAMPIILAGIFVILALIASGYAQNSLNFYVIVLLLVIYIFSFGFATGKNITSPIKKIMEKMIELSKGNLSSRVYLETKDELAELAKDFNKIAEDLEASRQREEEAEKSVGLKVRARTQELEETINALEQKVKNRTAELERLKNQTDA